MSTTTPRFLSAAHSDKGKVRGNNEDRVYADDARGIYMVIDGMGGHAAGEHAAEIALEIIRTRLERQTDDPPQRMREAITLANNAIFDAAQSRPEWHGMACVLTAVIVEGRQAVVGHVGDSRLYKLQGDAIEKITRDHSPVGEREDRGELSESAAMEHPRRNEVFRDVGSHERTPDEEGFIDILTLPFAPDCALLLCSDGLSDAVPSAKILEIVRSSPGNATRTVHRLIEAANERGKDNVSVILIEGERFGASLRRSKPGTNAGETTERLRRSTRFSPLTLVLCTLGGMLLGALLLFGAAEIWEKKERAPVVLTVNAPATIGSTMAVARPGDQIQIGPGVFSENIALKEGVSLTGSPRNDTVIQGAVNATGVHRVRLTRLTIRASSVGILLSDSEADIAECSVMGARDAAVDYRGASRGLMLGNQIVDNPGAGVIVAGSSTPELRNNVIAGNGTNAGALRPGLQIAAGARPIVIGNTFSANGAEPVWLPPGQEGLVQKNFFVLAPKGPPTKLFRLTLEGLP